MHLFLWKDVLQEYLYIYNVYVTLCICKLCKTHGQVTLNYVKLLFIVNYVKFVLFVNL